MDASTKQTIRDFTHLLETDPARMPLIMEQVKLHSAPAVRDWVTPRELADIRGIRNRSTVARWLRSQHLPARSEDRPWEPGTIPVDDSLASIRQ
jgi:hypothetical protein